MEMHGLLKILEFIEINMRSDRVSVIGLGYIGLRQRNVR